jgi:HK97 family phage portal protein
VAITWKGWMKYLVGGLWNPDIGVQWPGPMGYGNESLQPVSDERALQIGAVFRSIRIIAETCAALPMYGYSRLPNGDREVLPDSHWLNGLIYEPNDDMAGDEWRETQFAAMAGWGNGYTQLSRQSEGRVALMYPYKVDRMQVERSTELELLYRYPDKFGTPALLPKTKVLHLRSFSVDGIMGISPLGMARQVLGVTVGAEKYAGSFFASNGRPSGVMTSERLLTDAQRAQVRQEYGGMAEGGTDKRFWLLEGALKYQAITVSPEDMQMLQTRTFQISEIARIFGVPLFLLMETEKSTSWGSGLEQMNLGFLTYTLRPYLQRMVCTFNRRIIPADQRSKVFVDIDEKALLSLDSVALKELYASMAQNGTMTRNEIRRAMKLPQSSAKNMDAFTVQSALTTVENLGRVPTPAASTQPAAGV